MGDDVIVNVAALDLELGSGGFDIVHANLTRGLDGAGTPGAHVMKLNYTRLQHAVLPVEATAPAGVPLILPTGAPVGDLRAARPARAAGVGARARGAGRAARLRPDRRRRAARRLSETVRELRERGLLAGARHRRPGLRRRGRGDHHRGRAPARPRGALLGRRVCGPGPGILGSGSALGHGGMVALDSAHAALGARLPGRRLPAASSGDPRPRHRGLSHHTRTMLELALVPFVVAYAGERPRAGLGRHEWRPGEADLDGYAASGLPARTMGRSLEEDPDFFAAALAAGTVLATMRRVSSRFERIGVRERCTTGGFFTVRRETFRHEDGEEVAARDRPPHRARSGSSRSTASRLWLVRQPREAIGSPDLLELPAGKLDEEGEAPLDTAKRELAEEIGKQAEHWEPLGSFYTSPGFTDEQVHLFLATGISDVDERPAGPRGRADRRRGAPAGGPRRDPRRDQGLQDPDRALRAARAPRGLKLLAERDDRGADQRDLLRADVDGEHQPRVVLVRNEDEGQPEDRLLAVVDPPLLEGGLDVRDRVADPDTARLGTAADRDVRGPARVALREVDRAAQRRPQPRGLRVFSASSQPLRSLPTRPCWRSVLNVLPSLTWPTPSDVIFCGAGAKAGAAVAPTANAATTRVTIVRLMCAHYPTRARAKPS